MENNNFSQRVKDVLIYSREEANRLGNKSITPAHLLLGIIRDGEGAAIDALLQLGVDLKHLKSIIENEIREPMHGYSDENIPMDEQAMNCLKYSTLEARKLSSSVVDTEHLVLAFLKTNNIDVCFSILPFSIKRICSTSNCCIIH